MFVPGDVKCIIITSCGSNEDARGVQNSSPIDNNNCSISYIRAVNGKACTQASIISPKFSSFFSNHF
jgi:hypothetical protein